VIGLFTTLACSLEEHKNFIKILSEIPNSKIYNQEYPTQIRAIIKKKFIPLFLINFCSFDKFSFLDK
jgi:hypothetical protein